MRRLLGIGLATVIALGMPTVAPSAAPAVATAPAVPLSDCEDPDNGDPVVTAVIVTPDHVDVSRKPALVTVTVTATDTGGPGEASGVESVSVHLAQAVSNTTRNIRLTPNPGSIWTGRIRLVPGEGLAGELHPTIGVQDKAGNWSSWTPDRLKAAGIDDRVAVTDRNARDVQRPRMTLLRLSRRSIDTRSGAGHVVVTARLRDELSGVGRVLVEAEVGRTHLRLVRGTRRDGMWRGRLTVGRWVGRQTAHLYVKAFDRTGVRRIYGHNALRANGFPDRFEVVARRDDRAPWPTLVTTLPTTLDVRTTDASVPVRLRVVDARSGVASVSAYLTSRGGSARSGPNARLSLASGTVNDGYWEGTVPVSHCIASTDAWFLAVRARDIRGAIRTPTFTEQPVAVAAGDHHLSLPVAGSVVAWDSPARLKISFSEDVVGITADSAPVQRTVFRPTYHTDTVAGTWACNDADGHPIDCVAGPVRTAEVTLAEPPAPGAAYQALLNPDHVLDARDLAGNAFREFEVYLGQCCTGP